jgi:hypothetical protein
VNFFTPKLMKIRWSSLFFGSFAPHFQIKLDIHALDVNSRFVIMSELELFLLTGILTPNNTNYFLRTLPFSPWAVSATWLHVGALEKIHEK